MTYTKRDFYRIMKENGFELVPDRGKGSHKIFKKGNKTIIISRKYNKMMIQRIIKENGLIEQ